MTYNNTNIRIAVLITINNRYEETIKCLKCIEEQIDIDNFIIEIYISDSSLTDFKFKNYKHKIIYSKVDNDVFWNRGMINSWNMASVKNYDFYMWLCNDTYLVKNAISMLYKDFINVGNNSIIIGSTSYNSMVTYGGSKMIKENFLIPNGTPQKIKFMTGNIVLVPKHIYVKTGNLDPYYTHSLGDIDYGLRAIKDCFSIYVSSFILGEAKPNKRSWYDKKNFIERLNSVNLPLGVPIKEYFYFNYKHLGLFHAIKFVLSTSLLILSPKIHGKLKKNE